MTQYPFAAEAITESELRSRVAELGKAISADYARADPLFVVMLTGAIPFAADLVRHLSVPPEIDFMGLNRFGEGGRIRIAMDLSIPVYDRNVVIVEDIIDTGLTLGVLHKMFLDRGAATVATTALFDKTPRRVTDVPIEYRGFEVGDEYLVGYGLDWRRLYRNLSSVWVVLDMEAFIEDPLVLARELYGGVWKAKSQR